MKKGISLIEAILYVAIFAVISVIVINMLLATVNAFGRARVSRNVNEQGIVALERMLREVRLAKAVNTATSVLDANPGTLALTTFVDHASSAITTRRFFLQGSNLVMEDGLAPAVALTSGVTITNLVFTTSWISNVYYVRGSFAGCSDTANGLTPATAFCTISRAAQLATSGTVIYVGADTYSETIVPAVSGTSGKPIRFIADSQGVRTGDAGTVAVESGDEPAFNLFERSYITIVGFTVRNSKNGVEIKNTDTAAATNIVVENNVFTSIISGTAGVNIQGNSILTSNANHVIRGNTIFNSGGVSGVYVDRGSNFLIENNIIYSHSDGNIIVVGGQGTIRNNLLYQITPRAVVEIKDSASLPTSIDVIHNTVYRGRYGIEITGVDGQAVTVNIRDNIFQDNTLDGIKVNGTNVTCAYSFNIFFNDVVNGCTDAGGNRFDTSPLLVDPDGADNVLGGTGGADDRFYLSQIAAGQGATSPAVDTGSQSAAAAGVGNRTTRTDAVADSGQADLGYHYAAVGAPSLASVGATGFVRIELIIQGGSGRFQKSQTFSGTAVLRGSY